jgi:hypothetical protein
MTTRPALPPGTHAILAQTLLGLALVAYLLVSGGSADHTAALGAAMLISIVIAIVAGRRLSMAPGNVIASTIFPGAFTLAAASSVLSGSYSPALVASGVLMVVLAILLELIGVSLLVLGKIKRNQPCSSGEPESADSSQASHSEGE